MNLWYVLNKFAYADGFLRMLFCLMMCKLGNSCSRFINKNGRLAAGTCRIKICESLLHISLIQVSSQILRLFSSFSTDFL